MAGTHISIADTREAIASGLIPGSLSPGRTRFLFPELTYSGARGAARVWSIRVALLAPAGAGDAARAARPITDAMLAPRAVLPAGSEAEIITASCQVDGKVPDVVPTYVTEGKNLGKKHATNALTQALRNALGLYNKHLRRAQAAAAPAGAGHGEGAAAADPAAPQRPLPQLIKPAADAPLTPADFEAGVTVQRKLNGVRFIAHMTPEGVVVRYSRGGLDYPGQEQIAAELGEMFTAWRARLALADAPLASAALEAERASDATALASLYLDGELYRHGEGLNQISGQSRRADATGDPQLSYFVFDAFLPTVKLAGRDTASRERQTLVDEFFAAARAPHPHVQRVENFPAADQAAVDALVAQFLTEGYEGAVARRDAAGYRYSGNGYHSANAVKFKPTHDAEFRVVGYAQGGRGKEVGAVIWVCEVPADRAVDPADRVFTVVPKNMTYAERYAVYRCLSVGVSPTTPAVGKMTTEAVGDAPAVGKMTMGVVGASPTTPAVGKMTTEAVGDAPAVGKMTMGVVGVSPTTPAVGETPTTYFEKYVYGLPLTVEFKEISAKTGKPLQAKALAFRTYEGGPDADPIVRLLRECALV